MFDINPDSHRHHLSEIARQVAPKTRPFDRNAERGGRRVLSQAMLALAAFVFGGVAGGTLL